MSHTMTFALSDPLAQATLDAARAMGCPVAEAECLTTPTPAIRVFTVQVTDAAQAYRLAIDTATLLVERGITLRDLPRHGIT